MVREALDVQVQGMPVLGIENLCVGFARGAAQIEALRGISLTIAPAESVGIVGESGAGKTQIFMAAMGLLAGNARASGSVRFAGEELLGAAAAMMNRIRGTQMTMVFQDPLSALTPHLTIGAQLAEILVTHRRFAKRDAWSEAGRMLERVGLPDPQRRLHQYPHELSGGMRQRVMIGMGLLGEPKLLIADEPTSALDATVQTQIIRLLRDMREQSGMALALISHDLGVVAGAVDRILVMYAGRIVECASTAELFSHPRHPYTAGLLKCIESLAGPPAVRLETLAGQPPQPGDALDACAFAPRCPRAAARCRETRPALEGAGAHAQVACHFPLDS
jgi:oligopeptide transport system ATP-binding protein